MVSDVGRITIGSAIRIRLATVADGAAIAAMAGELGYEIKSEEAASRLISLPTTDDLLVATSGDQVVGWIQLSIAQSVAGATHIQIVGLVVREGWRGMGVARRLMKHAELWARQHGASTILVRSGSQREGAHRFYEALGYHELKTQKVLLKELGQ